MKEQIAYFVIVCLTLASGAPTDEESKDKVISKSFNYGNKEVIYSLEPFWKDEIVYAVCDGSDADKKCKIYVETTDQDKNSVQSCDLNLTYSGKFDSNVLLYNAGNSKAVFAVPDGDSNIKLISVKFEGCEIKEASIDVPKFRNPYSIFTKPVIVSHNDNYDVFFHNKQLCHNFLCKATFDYKGNVVKAVSSFPVIDWDYWQLISLHNIKYVNSAYLVSEIHIFDRSSTIYLIHNEAKEPRTLFNGTGSAVGLSTEENKLGYCVNYNEKLLCRQYNADGEIKKMEVNISVDISFVDILNLEKGLLILSIQSNSHSKHVREIFVAHYDEEGKEGKNVKVDLKCNEPKIVLTKLYKAPDGKYCVSSICMPDPGRSGNHSEFSRNTRCFHEAELF